MPGICSMREFYEWISELPARTSKPVQVYFHRYIVLNETSYPVPKSTTIELLVFDQVYMPK